MCGIAGIFASQDLPQLRQLGQAMLDRLAHRGPDGQGQSQEAEGRLWLGHRRLSVLDPSAAGQQPMESACGRYVLSFNGEIYNFQRLRQELQATLKALAFRGQSDTEVLLAGIAHWGLEACLRRCLGMFALALWDRHQRELWLARDRVGKKPLYYGWMGQDFVFASELKALRVHPHCPRRVDPAALTMLLRFGYVPAPLAILPGISKLEPGQLLCYRQGTLQRTRFWQHADWAGQRSPQSLEELDTLLQDAVSLRLISDVPLGVLLSGGIDSSLVAALAQQQVGQPLSSFSLGFESPEFDESEKALGVARSLGTRHQVLRMGASQALELLPCLPQLGDEPFCDPSLLPTYLVSRLARQQVTVVLSGDGGDEAFAGYDRYRLATSQWRMASRIPPWLRRGLSQVIGWGDRLFPLGVAPYLRDRLHGAKELLRGDCLLDNYKRLAGFWRFPQEALLHPQFSPEFEARLSPSGPDLRAEEWMIYWDLQTLLPDGILTKVDRASMAMGLEVRCPLLDHRVLEFAWGLPLESKMDSRESKKALRSLLFRRVPRGLVDFPKKGFCIPLAEWLRGPLRDWAEELLSPSSLGQDGYFRVPIIRQRWREFVQGGRNWQQSLWAILMFQQWQRSFRAGTAPQ